MRVSDSMIHDLALRGVSDARERVTEAQRVATTGVRVDQPSDDPVAASAARRRRAEEERLEAMLSTANAGAFGLQMVDSALAQMDEILERARELAVQAANDTLSASDRAMVAGEISALRDQALAVANTKHDDRYVFAGLREDQPPFAASGAFTGDNGVRELEVAPGQRVPATVPGGDVFAPPGGVDVFATLESLETSMRANDGAGIRGAMGDLERATEQVTNGRGRAGVALESLEMARSLGTRLKDLATEERASLVEADAFDALSSLARADAVLQQAVQIAARLPLPGLAQGGR